MKASQRAEQLERCRFGDHVWRRWIWTTCSVRGEQGTRGWWTRCVVCKLGFKFWANEPRRWWELWRRYAG